MLHQKFAEDCIQPQYTSVKPGCKDMADNFTKELRFFVTENPEFISTQSHMEFLCYCYDYYINCDPVYGDLPFQEKLKQAGEMAKNLMSIVIYGKRIAM